MKPSRCAIYTRKSSEEGLDQSFNSLHAQREACEAYILSQKHEGWHALSVKYDDGGFSGGNMERPALRRLLTDIDCSVQWIDERDSEFPAATSPPHIERLCVEPVEAEVKEAPRGACFLVLTHSHELDLRISEAILRRGDFAYLGLIGSTTKRARFVHRFEERGIARDVLARMTCPIGMPGIGNVVWAPLNADIASRAISGIRRLSAVGSFGPLSSFSRSTICRKPPLLVP